MLARFVHSIAANPAICAACIAAFASLIVSLITLFATVINTPLKYWLDNKAVAIKLNTEYQQKNISELQDLTRRYKGLLLEAAESLNSRFFNLYRHESELWLDVGGDYSDAGYYFQTFARRLASVIAIATALEHEAIYIDQAIGKDNDFQLVYMVKSWLYSLSNLNLFDSLPSDPNFQKDHLFKDTVRCIGEAVWINKRFASDDQFEHLMEKDKDVRALCHLLDGLNKAESRLRWDRLICLHILLINFLETFGYGVHKIEDSKLKSAISQIKNPEIRVNLADLFTKWQLITTVSGKHIRSLLME